MKKLFEYYFETDKLHFKYAKGEPTLKQQEFHDYNEFVFFISGKSFFISRNIQQELTPGSLILIPKEHFHQFCVNDPENYVRCILGFRETPETCGLIREIMNNIKISSSPDGKIILLFEQMINISKSNLSDEEKCLFINSSLIQLMIYLKLNPLTAVCDNMNLSPVVSKALTIIDEQYVKNLSVEKLSSLLFVSPSTLSHKFSKELNISVYQYITKKRLFLAHQLIQQGESLSNAALSSGFSDYSCFYRLYKKYYKN